MSDTCTGCKFCVSYGYTKTASPRRLEDQLRIVGYECHFNPPVMVDGRYGNWPKVKDTDWCGKWEGK